MKSRKAANGQRQARRHNAAARQRHRLNLKKAHGPLIPDRVLKALAEMALPPNKKLYDAKLRELLRGV